MASVERVLHVDLQDGFDDEPVVVRVDGEKAYRSENVRTDYRISRADSFERPVVGKMALVEVSVPRRELSDSRRVDVTLTPYVGISVLDGAIQWRHSPVPFGYM